MEGRKNRRGVGGGEAGGHKRGIPTYGSEKILHRVPLKGQISRYELMSSQLREGHTSFENGRDRIILCQHCYTREPYAASLKQSHDLQEEVM